MPKKIIPLRELYDLIRKIFLYNLLLPMLHKYLGNQMLEGHNMFAIHIYIQDYLFFAPGCSQIYSGLINLLGGGIALVFWLYKSKNYLKAKNLKIQPHKNQIAKHKPNTKTSPIQCVGGLGAIFNGGLSVVGILK